MGSLCIGPLRIVAPWLFMLILLIPGCGRAELANIGGGSRIEDAVTDAPPSQNIELGVIDCNDGGYACIPLSSLGIERADHVIAVKTSCDCTVASLVQYVGLDSQLAGALRLDFLGESQRDDSQQFNESAIETSIARSTNDLPVPMQLAVDVTLELHCGESRNLTLKYLKSPVSNACIRGNR